jgi:hypothetical protein
MTVDCHHNSRATNLNVSGNWTVKVCGDDKVAIAAVVDNYKKQLRRLPVDNESTIYHPDQLYITPRNARGYPFPVDPKTSPTTP